MVVSGIRTQTDGEEVRVDVRPLGKGARVRAGDGSVGYT